jgi:hypothetical protein
MRAFKFRSSAQIDFALDIIFNQRVHCADWSRLNDPMEGIFAYSASSTRSEDPKKRVEEIIREKERIKICSLSRTFDCHLLWAHYASGFSGVAVEVELPDDPERVKIVNYRGVFAEISIDRNPDPYSTALQILSSKYREWEYEQEVRILHNSEWFPLPKPVCRVIAGHRMQPALFEALRIICETKNIPFRRTGVGDTGIDADYVEAIAPRGSRRLPRKRSTRQAKS